MSARGQKHALPHCNSNGRFTSISGHKTADAVWRVGTGAQERVQYVQASRYILEPIEPPGCSLDPPFEPMLLPALRSQEDRTSGLDEQHPQVAIAVLGDASENCATACWTVL